MAALIVSFSFSAMRAFAISILSSIFVAGCATRHQAQDANADQCITNMMAIWWKLHYWVGEGDTYPVSLACLTNAPDTSIFLCPNSRHVAGAITDVADWTDYIYVSGDEITMFDVAMLICPPENHGGKFGHVVEGAGAAYRLPEAQVRSLTQKPWLRSKISRDTCIRSFVSQAISEKGMSTQAAEDPERNRVLFEQYMRTNTNIHVPNRWRDIYGRTLE